MALRNLRFDGDEILRKKSKPVKEIDSKIITLLDDMRETMHEHEGVGLASVQVGILKRIFVIEIEDDYYEFINPEIIAHEGEQINNEACLSVPNEAGYVERPEKVTIRATNRNGEEFELVGEGFLAIAICHEYDHLDGVLYIDKTIDEDELEEI